MIDFSGYDEWKKSFRLPEKDSLSVASEAPFNSLPVYGTAWSLAVEATRMAARLERNYRYSLGEDIRRGVKEALLAITLAGKGEDRAGNVHHARIVMLGVQLSLRLLNELKVLPDSRYVGFMEQTEDIIRQLSNWERSVRARIAAGMPPPP